MEIKKTPKADLENKRNIFVQIGLVAALGIVLMAFNINDQVKEAESLGDLNMEELEDEIIPVTTFEELQPPPPPPPPKVIEMMLIVDDDVELDEELEIDDTEADDETIIDAVPVFDSDEYGDGDGSSEVFRIVEDMPMFPGGQTALMKWIVDHIEYPTIAAENGIQGKVYIQFVVGKDGNVSMAQVVRGVDPSVDKEALRVINALPKWKPGKQRGKPVRVSFTVPINFQLN